jgi:predicted HAD superfamily Cof-like phosphohydrolase
MSTIEKKFNMIKTNFQKVMEFNRAFDMVSKEPKTYAGYEEDELGRIQYNPYQSIRSKLFTDSPKTIQLRLDLIKEEVGELNDAINANDIIEQRDACADILYVVYGMADVLGIQIDTVFENYIRNEINKLNMNVIDRINRIKLSTNNGSHSVTNFNNVKIYTNELLGFDITNKPIEEVKKFVNAKISEYYNNIVLVTNKDSSEFATQFNTIFNYLEISMSEKFTSISEEICGILKWTYLMTIVLGVNADKDFDIVHESNMSKLCDSEEDAKATVIDYETKYNNGSGSSPYDSPYYYELPDINKWIVKNKSTGKALKNIKYKKVDFTNTNL